MSRARTASMSRPAARGLLLLRLAVSAALVVDAVVHLRDAVFYTPVRGALLSEADLFRIQAVLALLLALLVLTRPRLTIWAAAALVAGSAAAAVVVYTYLDLGPIAGLPDLYEPSWGPPGKAISAVAEATGALLATTGALIALRANRPPRSASERARHAHRPAAPRSAS